jgi:RNA polymerase sigma-70 factor, ECF subfamily
MSTQERRLIEAFQAGDATAFETLYEQCAGRVLAFARRLTGHEGDAEDLVQEAFIAAFRARESFHSRSHIVTWLLAIAVRRWRDKERSPRPKTVPYCESVMSGKNGKDHADQTIEAVRLQAALDGLALPLREAFLLVAGQGMTHKEAAVLLACPIGTVKWRVAEASRRLRVALQDTGEMEERNVFPVLS